MRGLMSVRDRLRLPANEYPLSFLSMLSAASYSTFEFDKYLCWRRTTSKVSNESKFEAFSDLQGSY